MMLNAVKILVVAIILAVFQPSHAKTWPEVESTDFPKSGSLLVGDPLTERVLKDDIYSGEAGSLLSNVFGETLARIGVWSLLSSHLPELELNKIVAGCRVRFVGTFERIGCLGKVVHKTLMRIPWRSSGIDPENRFRTACLSFSRTFIAAFDKLELPNSYAQLSYIYRTLNSSQPMPHVAVQFGVRNSDGLIDAYYYDVLWGSTKIYPNSISSRRRHDRDSDGVSESNLELR